MLIGKFHKTIFHCIYKPILLHSRRALLIHKVDPFIIHQVSNSHNLIIRFYGVEVEYANRVVIDGDNAELAVERGGEAEGGGVGEEGVVTVKKIVEIREGAFIVKLKEEEEREMKEQERRVCDEGCHKLHRVIHHIPYS
ncbi:hypothetical protein VNO77_44820 [Canavalia gladiata]|uniref:Uncharacterized protein n=1 Tax=Canavalia gladiata TaxID=3824 RepID=A0AAN9PP42_CANGL